MTRTPAVSLPALPYVCNRADQRPDISTYHISSLTLIVGFIKLRKSESHQVPVLQVVTEFNTGSIIECFSLEALLAVGCGFATRL